VHYVALVVRYVWASPATLVGVLLVAAGARRARLRMVDGVVEAHGPAIAWGLRHLTLLPGGACALTLGHVVLGADEEALQSSRVHERVHVGQYETWGVLLFPAYLCSSLSAAVRGRHFYFDNAFEVAAFDACAPVNARVSSTTPPRTAHSRAHL
jgi:hypothetical protein